MKRKSRIKAVRKLLAKARARYEKHLYQIATKIALKVLAIDDGNEEALFYAAHGLYHAGQLRRSLQYWKRLEKIRPTEPNLHLNMGACYEKLGSSTLAIKRYRHELELNPVCAHALNNLGVIYYDAHRYRAAWGYLERAYSQKHCLEAIVAKLAHSYFKTGQTEKEKALYEEWLLEHPNDTWALNNLGSHLMGEGEYHRALLRLRKAARIDPNDKIVAKNIRKTERILKQQNSVPK